MWVRRPENGRGPSFDVEQLLSDGVDHGLHPGMEVELLEDVPDVVLDGVLGDEELLADIPVVETLGNKFQDLELALGKPGAGDLSPLIAALHDRSELGEE